MNIPQVLERNAKELVSTSLKALRPPPMLAVSEWADKYRVLTSLSSPVPGPWRTDRVPYLREPMDSLSDHSKVEKVVLWFGAQLGKTETGNNWIGYAAHLSPAPMLVVQSTDELAKEWSKQRLADMISQIDVLKQKIGEAKSRDSTNTIKSKYFPGGAIYVVGSNAPAGLRSKPVRYLFLDEVDSYPVSAGSEGDPISLAVARTQAFRNRKILITSTCTIKGESRIEREYLASDQRRFWVPCPSCEQYQILMFKNLRWPKGKPHKAGYFCEHCGTEIEERFKVAMLRAGEWRAENPDAPAGVRGYWLNSFNSPFLRWHEIAERFVKAKGDPGELQVVVNTLFAETWDADDGETVLAGNLATRTEDYGVDVPRGVAVLTAGVDVQQDRLEVSVWGWGANRESWLIEHRIIPGDPQQEVVWGSLDELLEHRYEHASGNKIRIASTVVDSGWATDRVYAFTTPRASKGVYPGKGRNGALPVWPKKVTRRKKGGKVPVVTIGVDTGKGDVYSRLNVEEGSPGYVHFPKSGYPPDYFDQLTAEKLRTRYHRGRAIRYWFKPDKARNEALDCAVYAYAAFLAWKSRGNVVSRALDALSVSRVEKRGRKAASKPPSGWLSPRPDWIR